MNTPDGAQLNKDALYQTVPLVFTESRDEKTGERWDSNTKPAAIKAKGYRSESFCDPLRPSLQPSPRLFENLHPGFLAPGPFSLYSLSFFALFSVISNEVRNLFCDPCAPPCDPLATPLRPLCDPPEISITTLIYNIIYHYQALLRCDLKGVASKGDFFLFASLPFPYLCSVIRRGSHW